MTAKLSEEILRELEAHGNRPVQLVDPGSKKIYFLVAQEQYERVKTLFEAQSLSIQEQKELLRNAGRRAGWDDPEMDAYDRYDERRPRRS